MTTVYVTSDHDTTMVNSPTKMIDETYNGWTNYETWNVALYIQNEYPIYKMAYDYVKQCRRLNEVVDYTQLADVIAMNFGAKTADDVSWTDIRQLDTTELDEMLEELVD